MEWSKEELSFLDVLVKLGGNNKLMTDVYSKLTDTHQVMLSRVCQEGNTIWSGMKTYADLLL